ncbi:MAG: hypothetical protein RBT15_06295 [Gudongella sp.]|jgi:hypothetical protein|nr:hypothetical protein [Gudongella sp.]
MSYKLKTRNLVIFVSIIFFVVLFTGCRKNVQVEPPTDSHVETPQDEPIEEISPEVFELVLAYLQDTRSFLGNVYYSDDQPEIPEEGDMRIDSLTYAGEKTLYETIGVAFELNYSVYWFTRDPESLEKIYDWHQNVPQYVVLSRSGYDDTWDRVLGESYYLDPDRKIDDTILEVAYGLMDIDVSISFDGYPQLLGPGSTNIPLNEESTIDILSDYEPIYNDGDSWVRKNYDGLTLLCYRYALDNIDTVSSMETTRSDVQTNRGIRIGMTRNDVFAAYPEINSTSYWGYEGDYLWYCRNDEGLEGFGASLLFWFEDDIIVKMSLINMFD